MNRDDPERNDSGDCPSCGKPMDEGVCPQCGAADPDEAVHLSADTVMQFEGSSPGEPPAVSETIDPAASRVDTRPAITPNADTSSDIKRTRGADSKRKIEQEIRQLGHYRVISELGRGGMGIVYKAVDASLKRTVALKVLIGGEHASTDAIARFQREAESVAKLGQHQGIVPVYDMGNEGNLHYFAMAFVDGKSVMGLIDGGELTHRRALVLTEKVARALEFAHANGVLHRDIKPDNILVGSDGEPQITDFGLAKDLSEDSRLTVSGRAMGTPQYMSPEQADGRMEKVDARSDVYSLGATLYQMLTSKPLFEAVNYNNLLVKIMTRDPVPPRKINPSIPRDVETICLKCIEKDPDRRYSKAGELADDIRRFLENEPISARPASIAYRVSKRVRRNPALYISGTLGTAALVATAMFFLLAKPALDRRTERAKLDKALALRVAPEIEAMSKYEAALALLESRRYEAAGNACEAIIEAYAHMQGRNPSVIPPVVNRDLLNEPRYMPFYRGMSFPLARAAAIKARALEGRGLNEEALNAWLMAYARAKPSRDKDETAVTATALIQIGRRQLALNDREGALRTFRKFLRAYPGHQDAPRAWFGFGEALWSEGRFAIAGSVFSRVREAASLSPAERASASWYADRCAFLTSRVTVARPGGQFFLGDADRDGKTEIFEFGPEKGLVARNLRGPDLVEKFAIEPSAMAVGGKPLAELKLSGLKWSPKHGPGRGAIFALAGLPEGRHLYVLPVSYGGAPGQPALLKLPPFNYIQIADMDGDGVCEIATGTWRPPSHILVQRIGQDGLVDVGIDRFGSYITHMSSADTDNDGRSEALAMIGEYGEWAAWAVRLSKQGDATESLRLTNHRFLGQFLGFSGSATGAKRDFWLFNRSGGDDRRILRGIVDPRYILGSGLFRVGVFSDDAPAAYSNEAGGAIPDVHDGIAVDALGFVAARVNPKNKGLSLGVRPFDRSGSWGCEEWSADQPLHALYEAELDGDKEPELLALCEKHIVAIGAGTPEKVEDASVLGFDASAAEMERIDDPLLGTAIEMSAMGWKQQALDLFRKAREEAFDPFSVRRAQLGEADCLLSLGRNEEAVALYRTMISGSSFGITEELVSTIRLLMREGEWKAARELLENTVARVPLPVETGAWARDTITALHPLARTDKTLRILPAAGLDPSYLCNFFLKVPGKRGDEFVFTADGARRSVFGRMIRFDGGPFRLEIDFVLQRFDWTSEFYFGLNRPAILKDPCGAVSGVNIRMTPGRCTNLPAIIVSVEPGGLSHGPAGHLCQESPRRLPTEYSMVLEYAPSVSRLTLSIVDRVTGEKWKSQGHVIGAMPPGVWCVTLAGSQHAAQSVFQGMVRVKRFDLVTASDANAPSDWEPSPGAFHFLRAQAAVALGDFGKASELAASFDPKADFYDKSVSLGYFDRRASDPLPEAVMEAVKAFALLRSGDAGGFKKQLAAAMALDPLVMLWEISRGFYGLSEEEKDAVAAQIKTLLWTDDAKITLQAVDFLVSRRDRLPPDFHQVPAEAIAEFREMVAQASESKNRAAQAKAVFSVLFELFDPLMAEKTFSGTILEQQAYFSRMVADAGNYEMSGDSWTALARHKELLEKFQDDARVANGMAWFLLNASVNELRDPGWAKILAQRAVSQARSPGSPFEPGLPSFLNTLAHAYEAAGELPLAVETQKQAIEALPEQAREAREQLQKALARFEEKAAAVK